MLDFDQEARRLRAALGLDGGKPTHEFHDMDRLWVDTKTGGAIWVGNENAAKGPLSEFERHDIAAVVNCTDDMPNFLEGAGPIYYRFNVAAHGHHSADPSTLAMWVGKLFVFIDSALAHGRSVLVHCLAGAHRAGTTAVLLLMYKEGLTAEDAVRAAQSLRPIINPIGQLPLLLRRYEALRDAQHREVWAEAEAARQEQERRFKARAEAQQQEERLDRAQRAQAIVAKAQAERAEQKASRYLGRDYDEAARAETALMHAREASRAAAEREAAAAADEQAEARALLEACVEALGAIGKRADLAYAHAHAFRLQAEEETQLLLEYVEQQAEGAEQRALMMSGASADDDEEGEEEEYEDDFESEDEEDEDDDSDQNPSPPPGAARMWPPGEEMEDPYYREDLAALRSAVEESREAVRSVEKRLQAAEDEEPIRQAAARRSAGDLLVASVSNALGVSRRDAEAALTLCNGDLEKAVAMLTEVELLE